MHKFLSLPFYLKLSATLVSIFVLGYIMYLGQIIIVPLILGLLFALLLVPVCAWQERKLHFPRFLASIVSLLFLSGLIVSLFLVLGAQLTQVKEDWPLFENQIYNEISAFQKWITSTFNIGYSEQHQYFNETISKSVDKGTAVLGAALSSLSSLFILFVFTFLYALFLLIYRKHILQFFILLNGVKHEGLVIEIVREIQFVVKKYLIGLAIQMLIVSILVFFLLSFMGIKYNLMLAILTGVFNVLPYVGIFVSILIIAIITFATSSVTNLIFVVVGLWIIHIFDSNFIVPKIVGSKVKVNSFFALLAIVFGELMWGVSGMFLAIPMLAIVKIISDRIFDLKPWGFLLGEEDLSGETFKQLQKELNYERTLEDIKDNEPT